MNLRPRLSIKDLLWSVLVIAAATGWSIDHYLAKSKHNAAAAKIAHLAPIEAAQQEEVHELRRKLEKERAKRQVQEALRRKVERSLKTPR